MDEEQQASPTTGAVKARKQVQDAVNKEKLERSQAMDTAIKRIALTQLELKARLQVEMERSERSSVIVMDSWRNVLRLATTTEVRQQIKLLAQSYERDLDFRRDTIRMLLKDLDDAEEYQRLVLQMHQTAIDKLLNLQERRLKDLHTDFIQQLSHMKATMEGERTETALSHASTKAEMLHFMAAVRENAEKQFSAAEADHSQQREFIKRKGIERIHALQTELDASIEMLERAFGEAHAKYLASTDQRVQDFKALAARGQYETHLKEKNKRAILRLQDRVCIQQSKVLFTDREEFFTNITLEEERISLGNKLTHLKERLCKAQEESGRKMKCLATSAAGTKVSLLEHVQLANNILGIAEEVRQLEPVGIRLTPFSNPESMESLLKAPLTAANVEIEAEPTSASTFSVPDLLRESVVSTVSTMKGSTIEMIAEEPRQMERFYRRYNGILLEKLTLDRKHQQLQEENAQLRAALQECINNTSISDAILGKPNPLIVINGRGKPNTLLTKVSSTSFVEVSVYAENLRKQGV